MLMLAIFCPRFIIPLILLYAPIYLLADSLPNFGDPSVAYLTPVQEEQLGKKFMLELLQSGQILADPVAAEYLQQLGQKLVIHSEIPKNKIKFFILKSQAINAFAAPDDFIVVNSGLITYVPNESELAAVIAHEIGHVSQHHLARMFETAKVTGISALAASLAAIAIGIINPVLGVSTLTAISAGYRQHLLNFSRADESEADRMGMQTLYKSGFDPFSMPHLFASLRRIQRFYPNDVPALLQTHPTDDTRIADSINRARLYPPRTYSNSTEFPLIQVRIKVETGTNNLILLKAYSNFANAKNAVIKEAEEYGYVLTLTKIMRLQQAKATLQPLLQQYPKQILFQLSAADIAVKQRDFLTALNILQTLYAKNPNYFPVSAQYAIALYDAGKYDQAIDLLQSLIFERPHQYKLYNYLAQAQGDIGDTQSAYLTQAKLYAILGANQQAIRQLKIGLHQKGKNPYGKIQILAMLQELKRRLG